MVSRVLRDLGRGQAARSSCSTTRRTTATRTSRSQARREGRQGADRTRTSEARVWFRGLQAIAQARRHQAGLRPLGDAVLPQGLRLQRGLHLPLDGQRLLADGRDRVGHRQGATHPGRRRRRPTTLVTYLRLWDYVGDQLPKRAAKDTVTRLASAQGARRALRSLYRSYEKAFAHWETSSRSSARRRRCSSSSARTRSSPSSSTTGSPGEQVVEDDEVVAHKPGQLALLSNVVDGSWLARPRTILIDSAQLESGEAMKDDFKKAAAARDRGVQARVPQAQPRRRRREARPTSDLLREVMNTVGKQGKLGEQVRCVVSVSMLTEGWDANTVTHILGVRAFGSQLLCEQVVGRACAAARTPSNDEGCFEPEYAEGLRHPVPVHLLRQADQGPAAAEAGRSRSAPSRAASELRITFPKLDGYRVELPDEEIWLDLDDAPEFEIGPNTVPTLGRDGRRRRRARARGGRPDAVPARSRSPSRSPSASSTRNFNTVDDKRPWLFPSWSRSCRDVDRAEGRRRPATTASGI